MMLWLAALPFLAQVATAQDKPIMLRRSGGFNIGGKIQSNPANLNQTLSCDHGYYEYFEPWTPRSTSIIMWHSSTTQTFQNRWDGGEGFKDKFLRRDYPVYLWDGPRVGRANWGCKPWNYVPSYRDQANFVAWNLGPAYPRFWDGVQFPVEDEYAWYQATSTRYVEFDTLEDVELQGDAASIAADTGVVGDSIVYLTNSASGLRAQVTVVKAQKHNIKAIVAYEAYGYVFPDTEDIQPGNGGFGPYIVPVEEFKKLANLTAIQFVWGDHRDDSFLYFRQCKRAVELINQYGGNAEMVLLAEDHGLTGSTHVAFADMDNEKVAVLLDKFLEKYGLDGYANTTKPKTQPKTSAAPEVDIVIPATGGLAPTGSPTVAASGGASAAATEPAAAASSPSAAAPPPSAASPAPSPAASSASPAAAPSPSAPSPAPPAAPAPAAN